ncbi:hypothetical protein [Amycolatopsis acidicola]|nr:hypothetical protein [Amycolatopsis acidicola]
MAKSNGRSRRMRRLDVMEIWEAPKRAWPVVLICMLIRWRAEMVLGVGFLLGMAWVQHELSQAWAWVIFAALVVVIAVVPQTRWFVYSRVWCVLDRHRLRTCLRQSRPRTANLDGAFPFMLWARPTKTGERVWLWARAGSSSGDLEEVLEYIAPACYAREARVHTVRKLSTLFAVDVVRRDPLDKSTPIDSPLAKVASLFGRTPDEPEEPITGATITPLDVKKPAETPARVVGGEDLSDYID